MADCGCNNFPSSLGNVTFQANVGINNTAPGNRLVITTTVVNDGIFLNNASNKNILLYPNLGQGSFNGIVSAGDRGLIYAGASSGSPGGGLVLAPWAAGPSGIRIDANGNVGIGRPTPGSTLDVNGTIWATGILMQGSGSIIIGGQIKNGSNTVIADTGGCYYAT